MKRSALITLPLCALLLSACDDITVMNWAPLPDHEVQPVVRNNAFGSATANNVAVLTGQTGAMLANLTRKFAAEVPATINFESS